MVYLFHRVLEMDKKDALALVWVVNHKIHSHDAA